MKTRAALIAGLAGISAGGLAAVSRRADRHAAEHFYDWTGPAEPASEVDGITTRYPGYANHVELFGSVHGADLGAVTRTLPTDDLTPVRLPDGRAAMFVGGAHYRDLTLAGFEGAMLPYGEVLVALLVTRRAAPPVVPLAGFGLPIPAGWRAGMFYLFVPVTHRWTRDAGWTAGFPKFVADLEFEETPDRRRVRAVEGGQKILDLTVPIAGRVSVSRQPMLGYTVVGERLFEVETRSWAYQQVSMNGRGVALELGSHPIADQLRELGLATGAFATLSWPAGRVIIPPGRPVGAARPFAGYRGDDRWLGRYTIHYPGTAPVDQYAGLTREGIERAIVRGGGRVIEEYAALDHDLGGSPGVQGGIALEAPSEPSLAG